MSVLDIKLSEKEYKIVLFCEYNYVINIYSKKRLDRNILK